MPELPEVETIKRILEPDLVGKIILNIKVLSKKQFFGSPAKLKNKKIVKIKRTGKVLNIYLSDKSILNIHLKMTGQLLFASDKKHSSYANMIPFTASRTMPAKTTRVIIYLKDKSILYFNDLRKFGWIKLNDFPLGPKSPDILSEKFTVEYLKTVAAKTQKSIKSLIMDQDKLSGVGNIYANDALFLAGIKPTRKSLSQNNKSITKLYVSLKRVIAQGIKDLGSTGGDEAFILPDGSRGKHQFHFLVYDREGKPCPNNCGSMIKRLKHNGRSSFYCPRCQR